VPCILRWPGKVTPGNIENDILSGLDWFPTFVAAAGNPNIVAELLTGKAARPTRSILTATTSDFITRKGPSSRKEIFYFTETTPCGSAITNAALPTSPAAGSATPSTSIGRS
jgi:arylsulfatase